MLKLNSNYAKSYIRDIPPQQSERNRPTTTERYYPTSSEIDYELPKKSMMDNDFRREKYDYKQPPISSDLKNDYLPSEPKLNKEKTYGYAYQNAGNARGEESAYRQDFGEYQRKTRNYDEPLNDLDSNYRDKSPRTLNPKRNNPPSTYEFELPPQSDQNYEPDLKSYKYSKYSGRANAPLESTFGIDKKQYAVKHSRRNEEVKNRIIKEQSYGRTYDERQERSTAYDNYLNEPSQPYDNYRNQQDYKEINPYKNSRRLQFQTFDKQEDWKTQRQRNNYDTANSQSNYPEDIPLTKQKSDQYAVDRFDRPSLNERKESIKKSIQGTPQKNYKAKFEPGSAERKNSLIQKSQMLQQKLKKLNMQYPAGERQKEASNAEQSYQPQRPISRNQPQQQNEDAYSRYTPSPHIQSSLSNRSSSCLKNNFRNINIGQGQRDITNSIRNIDHIRNKMLDSETTTELPAKGEAIQKITKLNEKINERIQSIISNYAKK